jgi:hypothetical protein
MISTGKLSRKRPIYLLRKSWPCNYLWFFTLLRKNHNNPCPGWWIYLLGRSVSKGFCFFDTHVDNRCHDNKEE